MFSKSYLLVSIPTYILLIATWLINKSKDKSRPQERTSINKLQTDIMEVIKTDFILTSRAKVFFLLIISLYYVKRITMESESPRVPELKNLEVKQNKIQESN